MLGPLDFEEPNYQIAYNLVNNTKILTSLFTIQ